MTNRTIFQQFVAVFAATAATILIVLQTGLVERISYAVEKGKLRALTEAAPSESFLEEFNTPNRIVAKLVTPAVVHIETVRMVVRITQGLREALRGAPADVQSEFGRIHPQLDLPHADQEDGEADRYIEESGLGSGFIFDAKRGHVLTNNHVIEGADRIEVTLADGRRFVAEVVGSDARTDLAVLRIPAERLHQIEFGESRAVAVGDEVFTLGNPFGLDGTFSRGIISALDRSGFNARTGFDTMPRLRYQGFIQTDAVINPGNSGGPLVNKRGQVIGINTAIATDTGHFLGVGFAIPSARVVSLIPKLLSGGSIERGFLGVSIADIHDAREIATALGWMEDYGVIVRELVQNSPAEKAGLEPGDIIVGIQGQQIEGSTDLMDTIAIIAPGTAVTVRYWRDGEFKETQVRLILRPDRY